jgi:hypothetical protein
MSLDPTAAAKLFASIKPACCARARDAVLRWSEAQSTRAPLLAAHAPIVAPILPG